MGEVLLEQAVRASAGMNTDIGSDRSRGPSAPKVATQQSSAAGFAKRPESTEHAEKIGDDIRTKCPALAQLLTLAENIGDFRAGTMKEDAMPNGSVRSPGSGIAPWLHSVFNSMGGARQ